MDTKINKEKEINKAIIEWMKTKNYRNSLEVFTEECCLQISDATTGNQLEKKWGTIIQMQKKLNEQETYIKQLKEDLEKASFGGTTNSLVKNSNENMGLPKFPEKTTLKGHKYPITCLLFHPIYNLLVSGSEDCSIIIWECEEFSIERSVKAHSNKINSIAFDTIGRLLATCSSDLSIKLWNFDTLTCIKTLNGHEHTVSSVEFSNDGNFIYSCSRDKTIKFWEISTGNCKKTLSGHNEWVRAISLNTAGTLIASCSDDETIIVWNLETGMENYSFNGHENKIESIVFVKNNISISNIYNSDYVESFSKSLNSDNNNPLEKIENEKSNETNNDNVNLIDLNKLILEKAKTKINNPSSTNNKEVKINKEYLISASRDKTIKLWDVFASSCIFTFVGHDNWVRSVVVHPNGKYVVSCSDDKSIRVWDLKTGRCVKKLADAHERFVTSIAIGVKFPLMASGSNDYLIKIWDCK